MDSLKTVKTLRSRLAAIVGATFCAASFMAVGAGSAEAASCGNAELQKIGKQDAIVQSCPKGKQVIYTVTCNGVGMGDNVKTASAYFNASESRITKIDCGPVGTWASSVDWNYA